MLIRKEEDKNVEREDKLSQDPVPDFEIVNKAYLLGIWDIQVQNLSNHVIINCELSDVPFSRDKHNHCLQLGTMLLSKDFSTAFVLFYFDTFNN